MIGADDDQCMIDDTRRLQGIQQTAESGFDKHRLLQAAFRQQAPVPGLKVQLRPAVTIIPVMDWTVRKIRPEICGSEVGLCR